MKVRVPGARKITAEWTGTWPNLCHGEWIIRIDGEKVELPSDVAYDHMGTFGKYSSWSFNENYVEEWSIYEDGLKFEQWVERNERWLTMLGLSDRETKDLYEAISAEDWRPGCCGGCI